MEADIQLQMVVVLTVAWAAGDTCKTKGKSVYSNFDITGGGTDLAFAAGFGSGNINFACVGFRNEYLVAQQYPLVWLFDQILR